MVSRPYCGCRITLPHKIPTPLPSPLSHTVLNNNAIQHFFSSLYCFFRVVFPPDDEKKEENSPFTKKNQIKKIEKKIEKKKKVLSLLDSSPLTCRRQPTHNLLISSRVCSFSTHTHTHTHTHNQEKEEQKQQWASDKKKGDNTNSYEKMKIPQNTPLKSTHTKKWWVVRCSMIVT